MTTLVTHACKCGNAMATADNSIAAPQTQPLALSSSVFKVTRGCWASGVKVKLETSHSLSLSFPHAKAALKVVVAEINIGPVYNLESVVGCAGGCVPATISNRMGHWSMASI